MVPRPTALSMSHLLFPLPSVWFMLLATDDNGLGPCLGSWPGSLARLDGPHNLCGCSMPAYGRGGGPCAGTWNRLASDEGDSRD